jgi:hypothetical protein
MMLDQRENTVAAFEQWRSNKLAKSSEMPIYLCQQALVLSPLHLTKIVTESLRISDAQLKRWHLVHELSYAQTDFIRLPALQTSPSSQSISFSRANGNQL